MYAPVNEPINGKVMITSPVWIRWFQSLVGGGGAANSGASNSNSGSVSSSDLETLMWMGN